ncbi:MAG: flagellin [Rhodospirillales bacterium]
MRTATLASNDTLVGYVLKTKARVDDLQTQVATEKRSQTYAGIAADTPSLVALEQKRAVIDTFQRNNALLEARLEATTLTVSQARDTVQDFRSELVSMGSGSPLDASAAQDLQEAAFRALKSLEASLNQDYNGRYLFSGSRTTTQPVSFGADTLAEFQAVYDGKSVVYPPTRDAHVGLRASFDQATTGGLTFTAGPPATISAANPCFANLPVGATIEIKDSTTGNNGVFTVVAKNGGNDTITVDGTLATPGTESFAVSNSVTAGTDSGATISTRCWYAGDEVTESQRVDAARGFTLDLNALDPAFEKAIRAIGIVAQGGLVDDPDRIDAALQLVNDALDQGVGGSLPYGDEAAGSIDNVEMRISYHQTMLKDADETGSTLSALFEERIAGLENVDKTEAIAKLLDESNALEASYQVLARVRQLNLTQYLT